MPPSFFAGLVLTLAMASGAANVQAAQVGPAPVAQPPLPRFLQGYSHPELTQCQTVSTARRECSVPAGVGGRYLVEVAGFANSTAADATLVMNIIVGEQVCIMQTGAKFTGRGYMHLICETTLATETPTKIAVDFGARDATLDKDGPKMVIRALPWDGVLSVRGADGGALPTPPGAPAPAAPPAKPGH